MKILGTITARTNIEKLNERGKKRLNAKLERHLARPHTLAYVVSAFIYILALYPCDARLNQNSYVNSFFIY